MLPHEQQASEVRAVRDGNLTTISSNRSIPTREEIRFVSRQLRRAKRRLLLKAVEVHDRPSDLLRDMLRQLSLDTGSVASSDDEDGISACSSADSP
jgi:hypothetical protein